MMSYAGDRIDRPHEKIQQSIRQYYKSGTQDTCLKENKRTETQEVTKKHFTEEEKWNWP